MAVSKRLRFEILKRDNHTCQYCGRSAPEVKLHVDHIVPTTLGGDDKPTNLTTACVDCNSGKSSTSPGAAKVAAPSIDAHRWRNALEEAAEDHRRHREREREACDRFAEKWPWSSPPDDWKKDVGKFVRMGLAPDDLMWILERAIDRCSGYQHTWLYFCKVAWSEVKAIRERATLTLEAATPAPEPVVEEPEAEAEPDPVFDADVPPWYEPLPALCIECDDAYAIADGLCRRCRRIHYEGIA